MMPLRGLSCVTWGKGDTIESHKTSQKSWSVIFNVKYSAFEMLGFGINLPSNAWSDLFWWEARLKREEGSSWAPKESWGCEERELPAGATCG